MLCWPLVNAWHVLTLKSIPPSLLFRVDSFVESPISDPSADSLILIIKVPHWAWTTLLPQPPNFSNNLRYLRDVFNLGLKSDFLIDSMKSGGDVSGRF